MKIFWDKKKYNLQKNIEICKKSTISSWKKMKNYNKNMTYLNSVKSQLRLKIKKLNFSKRKMIL